MKIRTFKKSDFSSVKSIYQQGIDTGNATFQNKAKDWNEWTASFLTNCRIVAELNEEVVGWAAQVSNGAYPFARAQNIRTS